MLEFLSTHPVAGALGLFFLLVIGLALNDVFQSRSAIRHNFPVLGWARFLFEKIGPEMRQYLVANDKEERPFNRDERRWIYATAKGENNNFGFGTTEILYGIGYPIIKHAAFPVNPDDSLEDPTAIPCAKVMGQSHGRRRPFRPTSVVNISAMSFGSLGKNAISALNHGAKSAGCFHNTGEGSVSPYHKLGADLMWQLGTAYFGARNADGSFSLEKAQEKVRDNSSIRCIEIKLSQGAKPGKGGILPGSKVTAEIALTRGIPEGEACLSPNSHREFSCANTLIDFVERIAEGTGLPVGIKSAIGEIKFWEDLALAMRERKVGPDFITIDGGEGGTGAAPLTFADHVALPFKVGFQRVYEIFKSQGVAQDIVWIGSGKLGLPDRAVVAMAMGCDLISIAREAMMAIGCIQAQHCHTGFCPAGVATHNPWLQAGLDVSDKSERFARFVKGFRKELLALSHTAGYEHPCQFTGEDIEFSTGVNKFSTLSEVLGYEKETVSFTSMKDLS